MSIDSKINTVENFDINEIISAYTKHWKWFVFSGVIALTMAFLYLRYTTPEYIAEAKIQILDENSSGAGLGLFQDLELLSGD